VQPAALVRTSGLRSRAGAGGGGGGAGAAGGAVVGAAAAGPGGGRTGGRRGGVAAGVACPCACATCAFLAGGADVPREGLMCRVSGRGKGGQRVLRLPACGVLG
jgi:hypothetical protein